MRVRVTVMPKAGVLDPQGKAIGHALGSLGFGGVGEVRAGKVIELEVAEADPAAAVGPDGRRRGARGTRRPRARRWPGGRRPAAPDRLPVPGHRRRPRGPGAAG